ncbi:MAG TPA: LysR substrate-binding domain-containing protein [Acetobacteraceae bacterium]|nr:LysR substrate-binding domain-containing protein [Acetobacteraceae bacterium]
MNTTLLRAFHRVAQAGSFTGASRAAAISQPTLSAQVRALEASYGVSLFNRHGRKITVTPIGQSLMAITTRLFAAEDEARDLLAGALTLTRGQLRVSADSPTHVMPLLAVLKRKHPGLTFSLRIGNSSDVIHRVLDFEADAGVTAKQTSDPRIRSLPIRSDKLVLFVPKRHPWARRRSVAMGELAGCDLVIRERGSITREVFETRLAESGVRPGRLIEVQTREAVREAVLADFGIGIVFESELGQDAQTHPLDVRGVNLLVTEYLICLEERHALPLVRSIFDIARDALEGEPPPGPAPGA